MERLLILYLTLAGALASAAWPPALEQWIGEIQSSGGSVIAVPVATENGVMRLEGRIPYRWVVARYLADEHFRAQLAAAYALNLNYRGPEGQLHFIVLNVAREAEWKNNAAGLLAHEIGHAWLDANGYAGLPFESGPGACLATHSTDIVQHALIREQMRRRQIDAGDAWIAKLAPLLNDPGAAIPDTPCGKALLLSQWIDARLGTPGAHEKLQPLESRFPEVAALAAEIEQLLATPALADRSVYRDVLHQVHRRISGVSPIGDPPPAR